jgi:hypothetical protein
MINRECRPIKPDTGNSYKLTITSKLEVDKVLKFFTCSDIHPLKGNKLIQFNIWIENLKISNRYKNISFFN